MKLHYADVQQGVKKKREMSLAGQKDAPRKCFPGILGHFERSSTVLLMLYQTEVWTDKQTDPLVEMRGRILKRERTKDRKKEKPKGKNKRTKERKKERKGKRKKERKKEKKERKTR